MKRKKPGYLLFWPVFVLRYLLVENFNPAKFYHPVRCSLDSRIPFQEGFLIPYVLWYVFFIGAHLWLYMRNDEAYIQYSKYLILSFSISTAVFLLYPTSQDLRPEPLPRDNLLTEAARLLYRMDTNTNVCPSEHVIGAVGFWLAVRYSKAAAGKAIILTGAAAFLSAISTVFLKQHSVLDILAALPVCLMGWYWGFFVNRGEEYPLK